MTELTETKPARLPRTKGRGDWIPALLGCGALLILIGSLAIAVVIQVWRRQKQPVLTPDQVKPEVVDPASLSLTDVMFVSEIQKLDGGKRRFVWDWAVVSDDPQLPIQMRIPQLQEFQPYAVMADPDTSQLLPATPKQSRMMISGDFRLFVEFKLLAGDIFRIRFWYFFEERTGYSVVIHRTQGAQVFQDRLLANRAEQSVELDGIRPPIPAPLKLNEWCGVTIEVAGGRINIYVDSVLLFEGDMPDVWLVDDKDPLYRGGLPGKHFGAMSKPPRFGNIGLYTDRPYQGLFGALEISAEPDPDWVKQRKTHYSSFKAVLDQIGEPIEDDSEQRPLLIDNDENPK